jgi:hypothetical protein
MNSDKFGFDIASKQALDAIVENSDASYSTSVPSGDTLILPDINVTDSTGTSYSYPSVQDVTCTPFPIGATLLKTGQTVSFSANDDGATQRGRMVSFLQLPSANPFGNTNRFVDKTGGSTFTNKVAYDWSTYDGKTILAYYFGDTTTRAWATQLNQYVGSTFDGLTGWYLTNFQEMNNILNAGLWLNYMLNYPPFNTTLRYFWISSGPTGATGICTDLAAAGVYIGIAKTSALYGMWVRVCTVTIAGSSVIIT